MNKETYGPSRAMLGRDLRLFIREVPAAILIAIVLGIFCALAAGALSHGSESSYTKFKVAVVDEEGSFVSGMALSMITGNRLLSNLDLVKTSGEQAEAGVADGTYTAAIFLPDGFSGDYSVGNYTEARIVISDKAPLQADVLKLVASFGEDLLSTGQYGVFAGENLVLKTSPERHSSYLAISNTKFVAKVVSDPMIRIEKLSYGQTGVNPFSWYVLLYVMTFFLLMILGCFFMTRDGHTAMLRRLWSSGVREGAYLGSKLLWAGLFYLILSAVILGIGSGMGMVSITPLGTQSILSIHSLLAVLSLLAALTCLLLVGMAIILSLPEAQAVTAVTLTAIIGLFASGGILPRLELPGLVVTLGDLLPIGAAARTCAILLGGTFQPLYLIVCLLWALGAYGLMHHHLERIRKGDNGKKRRESTQGSTQKNTQGSTHGRLEERSAVEGSTVEGRTPSSVYHETYPVPNTHKPSLFSMVSFSLALKRFLRPSTLAMLLAVLLTILGGQTAGRHASLRPCGVLAEEDHESTEEVAEFLLEKDFVRYTDRASLERDISNGKLDCGVVLLKGLGEALSQGSYEDKTALLLSPDSFLTETYEANLTAALFKASAPALVYQSALESKVTLEMSDIRQELKSLWEGGHRFNFILTTSEGKAPLEKDPGQDIALAASALLLFAAIVTGTRRLAADADVLRPRVGRKAAITRILVPGLLIQGLFFLLAASVLGGEARIALPFYILALTALGLLLARLPLQIRPLVPIVLLGALAMLPMYYDMAAMLPQLSFLHYVLPPCWLLKLKDAIVLFLH